MNSISSTKSVEFNEDCTDLSDYVVTENHLDKTFKEEKFYPFIKQIFMGLEYLNKENIVHRDLKLSNIFLTKEHSCKIGDFGFASIIP